MRPWLGGTTAPDSAAKPINRGARSGVAIRLRQLQSVVVSARYDNGQRARPGRLVKRSRSCLLMGGDFVCLEGQEMRDGPTSWSGVVARVSCALVSFAVVDDVCVVAREPLRDVGHMRWRGRRRGGDEAARRGMVCGSRPPATGVFCPQPYIVGLCIRQRRE